MDAAVETVWREQTETIANRLAAVQAAVDALGRPHPSGGSIAAGERAAHMLAGSLAMFGFERASRCAHRLERELADPARARPERLERLTRELIEDLGCSDARARQEARVRR